MFVGTVSLALHCRKLTRLLRFFHQSFSLSGALEKKLAIKNSESDTMSCARASLWSLDDDDY